MDFSFITEEEEEDSFSSLSSEALTRVLLLLFLSWFVFFFVNVVFCFVVVVVIEEGGRTPLPLRRTTKAPRPPRGQKNAFAFSEKAEDDANIIIVIKVRLLRACVCLCFKWPALCALRLILMERISFFSSSSFPHFERRVSNVYLREDDDDEDNDDDVDDDNDDDEKSFSLLFAKIRFF